MRVRQKRPARKRRNARKDWAHQGQRRQEVLTELPVADPGLALGVVAEGERVDEDRASVLELDVVGRRVAQRHVELERASLDAECQQRGVLELAEAPLVGIGHEVELLGQQGAEGLR